ncbi:MAG: DUF2188 domain-containing protein [Streptosporangiales bacterium]
MDERHITLRRDGRWQIINPLRREVCLIVETQAEAVERATRALRSAGGGRLLVYDPDGGTGVSQTVEPGPITG